MAKNHGIFGFGIVYNMMNNQKFKEEILNLFSSDNLNNFPFFIIIDCKGEYNPLNQNLLITNRLIENITFEKEDLINFTDSIKNYLMSENYIKLRDKPILGFFQSSLSYHLITNFRKILENEKNKIYIIIV